MPAARRVQVVPPEAWDEEALVAAARQYAPTGQAVRPGDAVGDLVVVAVDPAPGATLAPETEIVIAPEPPRADAPRVDVAILLDVSESMGIPWDAKLSRLAAARESLAAFVRAPGPSVATVVLFEYAKEARLVRGPADPRAFAMAAEPPRPKGRSHTASALDAALAHLAARIDAQRAQAILLLTDGVGEAGAMPAIAQRAARLKVPVHCIVFAPEVDELFDALAKTTGGSAQRAGYPLTIEFEHAPTGG